MNKILVLVIPVALLGTVLLLRRKAEPPLDGGGVPSAYLIDLQTALAELAYEIETWGERPNVWYMIPGYGLYMGVTWDTYSFIQALMVDEAIAIGLIISIADCYFENHHMYHNDGSLIV